jgi:CubicO group peptidase (beta-lactamase class C family)
LNELNDIRGLTEAMLEDWKTPGAAVSVVKDGELVFAEGFGYRDMEKKEPMTADTVLPIGSATKSFTSMAAQILADEGRLDLDKPVNEYIPGFKMFDPAASAAVSVRDMLCHRTGLPRHEFMWAMSNFTREDLIRRVRYLENFSEFRKTPSYQNHMYAAAGYAVEKITGMTWEAFVRERILDPLGMTRTNFSYGDSVLGPDCALPYKHDKEGSIVRTEYLPITAAGPAGSMNSTVREMAEWVKLVLAKGAHKGGRIVSEEKFRELHTPHVHYRELPWSFPEVLFPSYGLGWFMDVYRGRVNTHHGGNIIGFTALVSLLPDENLGLCILTNMNQNFMVYPLQYEIFDRILGVPETGWSARYKKEADKLKAEAEAAKAAAGKERTLGTKPALPPGEYCGEYTHPGYGSLIVTESADGYDVDLNGAKLRFEHYQYDHFNLVIDMFDIKMLSRFNINGKGKAESVSVPFEPSIGKDIVFMKKAD